MLLPRYFNWDECSLTDYEKACHAFGYNCESSPDFLKFMLNHGAPLRFFAYKKNKKMIGSVCVENGWVVNDMKNKNRSTKYLPIPKTSTYIPFSSESKGMLILPFKSKCLHPLQRNVFSNTSYSIFNDRKVAISKDLHSDFSKKTIATREREARKFVRNGGCFVSVSDLDSAYVFDIYKSLYFSRRQKKISEENINRDFFIKFHKNLRGDVLFFNDEPVAMQLLLSVTSNVGFFVDFINIGYKNHVQKFSLGTLIMWRNLFLLTKESEENKKQLYYSYGSMSGDYKERWCNPESVGRVLI